jgi:hypothetical protein
VHTLELEMLQPQGAARVLGARVPEEQLRWADWEVAQAREERPQSELARGEVVPERDRCRQDTQASRGLSPPEERPQMRNLPRRDLSKLALFGWLQGWERERAEPDEETVQTDGLEPELARQNEMTGLECEGEQFRFQPFPLAQILPTGQRQRRPLLECALVPVPALAKSGSPNRQWRLVLLRIAPALAQFFRQHKSLLATVPDLPGNGLL